MKKAVAIKDIAEALGLSRNTVSKALNGQHVPPKTKELVLKKAKELNYKSLNDEVINSKSYRILLFSGKPFHNINFFTPIVKSLQNYCYERNYEFIQYTCNSNNISFGKITDYIKSLNIDGIIAIECFEINLIENLLSLEIPICFIDFPGRYFKTNKVYDLICSSDQKSVCNYVKSLVTEKGFQYFAFVGDYRHCLSFHERYMGMLRGMQRSNIQHSTIDDILDNDDEFRFGDIESLKRKIQEFERLPDCFVCCNDFVARRLIIALKELGYSVPLDTTIVGYDGVEDAINESPSITTFHLDKEFLAQEAIRLLTTRIERKQSPIRVMMVESVLVVGESTEK